MGKKQFDQVIALINAALRNGQPQSWMYESLGIAMELDGRSKTEIERAVMSAADFSTSADELMYIAQYLSRLGLDRRAMLRLSASDEDRAAAQRSVCPGPACGRAVQRHRRHPLGDGWHSQPGLADEHGRDRTDRLARRQGHARAARQRRRDAEREAFLEAIARSRRPRLRRPRFVDRRRGHRCLGRRADRHDLLAGRTADRGRRRQARRCLCGRRQAERRCRAKFTSARRASPASIACEFAACGAKWRPAR